MPATGQLPQTASHHAVPLNSAGVIERPRLFERLDKGALGLLTVVTGPTGTGKTDLLISWLKQADLPGPIHWITAPSTSDPAVFWSAILSSLHSGGAAVPTGDSRPDALLRAVVEHDRPVTIVVDDFHRTTASLGPEFVALARNTINLRIIAAGRRALDPEFLPLQLAGHLHQIDAPELAFTAAETDQVAAAAHVGLEPDELRSLHRTAEGWPAAVRFALQEVARDDPQAWPSALDTYVRSGIVPTVDTDELTFLQCTSVLEQLEPSALKVLLDEPDPSARLRKVQAAGFLVGSAASGYRQHRLLREVLLRDQTATRPGDTAVLHRKLAGHFRSHNAQLALKHARRADDPMLVLDICRQHWFCLSRTPDAVIDAFSDVPDAMWQDDPELLLTYAAAHRELQGHEHSAVTFLLAAQEAAQRQDDTSIRTAALIATGWQLTHLNSGDHGQAVSARSAVTAQLRAMPQAETIAHSDSIAFFHASCGLTEVVLGHFQEAAEDFQAGRTAATTSKNAHALLMCASGQVLLDALTGRLARAEDQLPMVQQLADDLDTATGLITGPAFIGAGLAAMERQQPDRANCFFTMAHDSAAPLGQLWPLLAYGRATVLMDQEQFAAGLDIIRTAIAEFDQSQCSPFGFALLVKAEAELLLKFDQPDAARDALALVDTAEDPTVCMAATRARIAMYEGNPATACELVQHWLTSSRRQLTSMHIDAFATHSVAALLCGRKVEASRSYQQAVAMSERSTCRRPLSLIPRPFVPLLQGDATQDGRREVLTPRERVVLGHIGRDATIREIASQLSVSQNTLKTQLRGLYRKLDARSRAEALSRARSLNLL